MNLEQFLILIIVGIAGVLVGRSLAVKHKIRKIPPGLKSHNRIKKERVEIAKNEIIKMLHSQAKVTNNDVEKSLGVSDATATNYLEKLEKEGKIIQEGKTGRSVFYRLKR